jgi:hypothetical protein
MAAEQAGLCPQQPWRRSLRSPSTTREESEMIPMHPSLISQLSADRQADLTGSARHQRLARQALAARRAGPGPREYAAPLWPALGRLLPRRPSPRTVPAPAAGPGEASQATKGSSAVVLVDRRPGTTVCKRAVKVASLVAPGLPPSSRS